jgi:hypothetical protein
MDGMLRNDELHEKSQLCEGRCSTWHGGLLRFGLFWSRTQ